MPQYATQLGSDGNLEWYDETTGKWRSDVLPPDQRAPEVNQQAIDALIARGAVPTTDDNRPGQVTGYATDNGNGSSNHYDQNTGQFRLTDNTKADTLAQGLLKVGGAAFGLNALGGLIGAGAAEAGASAAGGLEAVSGTGASSAAAEAGASAAGGLEAVSGSGGSGLGDALQSYLENYNAPTQVAGYASEAAPYAQGELGSGTFDPAFNSADAGINGQAFTTPQSPIPSYGSPEWAASSSGAGSNMAASIGLGGTAGGLAAGGLAAGAAGPVIAGDTIAGGAGEDGIAGGTLGASAAAGAGAIGSGGLDIAKILSNPGVIASGIGAIGALNAPSPPGANGSGSATSGSIPDYKSLIADQLSANKDLFKYQLDNSRVNQTNPYGTSTWAQGPDGTWSQNQSLNPSQQGIFDTAGQGLQNLLNDQNADAGKSSLITDPNQYNKSVADAVYNRYATYADPATALARKQLESRLADRGFSTDSEGYNQQTSLFNDSTNKARLDAENQAEITGSTQGLNEANFANKALLDKQNLRSNMASELTAARNGTTAPVAALGGTAATPAISSPDAVSAAQQAYQRQLDAYNAQIGGLNSTTNAFGSIGGAISNALTTNQQTPTFGSSSNTPVAQATPDDGFLDYFKKSGSAGSNNSWYGAP